MLKKQTPPQMNVNETQMNADKMICFQSALICIHRWPRVWKSFSGPLSRGPPLGGEWTREKRRL